MSRFDPQAARARCEVAKLSWSTPSNRREGDLHFDVRGDTGFVTVPMPVIAAIDAAFATLEALEEAQGKLLAIKGRLLEVVEECQKVGEDPSYLFSMLDVIDPKILDSHRPKEGSE